VITIGTLLFVGILSWAFGNSKGNIIAKRQHVKNGILALKRCRVARKKEKGSPKEKSKTGRPS